MNRIQQTYILASSSPRRKELLMQAGIHFQVIPSNIDENITKTEPKEVVMELARQKADHVFRSLPDPGHIVIGADTIVVYENRILGKPADEEEAFCMLSKLSGHTHQVYTGVAIIGDCSGSGKREHFFCECTDVNFYPVSDEELRAYIETGDPLDKAGAYGIQGPFAIHVKGISGDYNNVVGLPIAHLYHELKDCFGSQAGL